MSHVDLLLSLRGCQRRRKFLWLGERAGTACGWALLYSTDLHKCKIDLLESKLVGPWNLKHLAMDEAAVPHEFDKERWLEKFGICWVTYLAIVVKYYLQLLVVERHLFLRICRHWGTLDVSCNELCLGAIFRRSISNLLKQCCQELLGGQHRFIARVRPTEFLLGFFESIAQLELSQKVEEHLSLTVTAAILFAEIPLRYLEQD